MPTRLGVLLRVVLGERGLKEGKLEMKWRWAKDAEMIDWYQSRTSDCGVGDRRAEGEHTRFRGQVDFGVRRFISQTPPPTLCRWSDD